MKKSLLRPELADAEIIVVKVGSRIVASGTDAQRLARLEALCSAIATLRRSGKKVVLVSSGAIASGMAVLGLTKKPATIPDKQACASIGQIRLMSEYARLFKAHDIHIGQVLLTWDDLRNKTRYLNLRNTIFALLESGALPIINENDSVSVNEIRFGDNDTLGGQMALLLHADVFVNCTDVPGLFSADPRKDPSARHIPIVSAINPAVHLLATEHKNELSVGGMVTKLRAAEAVTKAGIFALIGDGFSAGLLEVLRSESAATLFVPSQKKMSAVRRWIAFSGSPAGFVIIDDGAKKAIIDKGKSLLAAGISAHSDSFNVGDMIDIRDEDNNSLARGLVNYSSDDIARIAGHRTADIQTILGGKTFDEVIHRDNLVLI